MKMNSQKIVWLNNKKKYKIKKLFFNIFFLQIFLEKYFTLNKDFGTLCTYFRVVTAVYTVKVCLGMGDIYVSSRHHFALDP